MGGFKKRLTVFLPLACLIVISRVVPAASENVDVAAGVGDTTAIITGKTSPAALVTILDEGATAGSVTTDSAGAFSKQLVGMAPGIHHFGLFAADLAGDTTDTINLEINLVEHAATTIDVFLPPTMSVTPLQAFRSEVIALNGATIPGGTLRVTLDNGQVLQSSGDAAGRWSLSLPLGQLSFGQHELFAVTTDENDSSQSYPTKPVAIELLADRSPFIAPFSAPQRPSPPVIVAPSDGLTILDDQVTISGTGQPGDHIDLFDGNHQLGATFVDAQGRWSLTLRLDESHYSLRARACRGEMCGGFSATIHLFHSAAKTRGGLRLAVDRYWYLVAVNQPVATTIHIRDNAPDYQLIVDWGDGKVEHLVVTGNDQLLRHVYTTAGRFIVRVTGQDAKLQTTELTLAVQVTPAAAGAAQWLIVVALPAAVLLVWGALRVPGWLSLLAKWRRR